jgi:hypothetical protein
MSLRGSRVNEEDAILSKKKFKEEEINERGRRKM